MKLKTIDDIDWKEQGHVDSVDIINNDTLRNFKIALYPSSFKKIIRQEAIKWVKEMDKCSDGRGFFCLVHSQDSKECENDMLYPLK